MKKVSLFLFGLAFVIFVSPLEVGAVSCNSGKGTCQDMCITPPDPDAEDESSDPICVAPTDKCCTPKAPTCTGGICKAPETCTAEGGTSNPTCSGSCPTSGDVYCMPKSTPPPGGGGGGGSITFSNPLDYDTVEQVLGSILSWIRGIIVALALVFIVIGAVLYVTSAGNDKQIEMAKNAILASMIGLALGIAGPTFLREISVILGWGVPAEVVESLTLAQILLNVLSFLLGIVGVLAIIMLVVGGVMYLTSGGDEGRIETGKKIVIWSIVGITVALSALIIVSQIASFF